MRKTLSVVMCLCGLGLMGTAAAVGLQQVPQQSVSVPDAATVPAQGVDTVAIETAWRGWMADNGLRQASLTIGRGGDILHSVGQGRSPQGAFPVASLSKAITAICLNQLLETSPYTWDSTIGDLLPEFAKMNLTPAPEAMDLTLSQIVTHTSGLPRTLEYGQQAARHKNLASQPVMVRAALKEPANFGTRGRYTYSNANYAILGLLIEAMSGHPYGDYCKETVTAPAGAKTAVVGGRMASTVGYGGWSISTEDYARFAMHWFAPDQPWMTNPRDFGFDARAQYGLGVHVFAGRGGTSVNHTGMWRHSVAHKPNLGAYFLVLGDGTTLVSSWEGALDIQQYRALDAALRKAM